MKPTTVPATNKIILMFLKNIMMTYAERNNINIRECNVSGTTLRVHAISQMNWSADDIGFYIETDDDVVFPGDCICLWRIKRTCGEELV